MLEDPVCSVCLQLESGALQFIAGVCIPALMGLVTASMVGIAVLSQHHAQCSYFSILKQ